MLTLLFTAGSVLVISQKAGTCSKCGHLTKLFINREGKTVCLECNHKAKPEQEPCR